MPDNIPIPPPPPPAPGSGASTPPDKRLPSVSTESAPRKETVKINLPPRPLVPGANPVSSNAPAAGPARPSGVPAPVASKPAATVVSGAMPKPVAMAPAARPASGPAPVASKPAAAPATPGKLNAAPTPTVSKTAPVRPLSPTPVVLNQGTDNLSMILGVVIIVALLATILFPFIIR